MMKNKNLLYEIHRMKELAGIISESSILNEDYLELKSIAKQLYTLLKSKGYDVRIVENSSKSKYAGGTTLAGQKYLNNKGGSVEIHQFSDVEQIGVFVPAYTVIYQFIKNPANHKYVESIIAKNRPDLVGKNIGLDDTEKHWTHIKNFMYGKSGKIAEISDFMKDQGIRQTIGALGKELQNAIKSKYPTMLFSFEDDATGYSMYFAEPRTAKGGIKNPNQRPNAPKPEGNDQQKMAAEDSQINERGLAFNEKTLTPRTDGSDLPYHAPVTTNKSHPNRKNRFK